MKRTYDRNLGEYYEDLDDDLEVSENQLKKAVRSKRRPMPRKFPK